MHGRLGWWVGFRILLLLLLLHQKEPIEVVRVSDQEHLLGEGEEAPAADPGDRLNLLAGLQTTQCPLTAVLDAGFRFTDPLRSKPQSMMTSDPLF